MKDERVDGAAMGAVVGLVLTWLSGQSDYLRTAATCAAAGFLIDAAETNRQPLYRAPSTSAPALKVTWRF
jgi:hypothetical protein